MSLNLAIPGNPSDIRVAAHWLDPGLAGALDNTDIELTSMVYDAESFWTGESGYAFNSATQAVRRGNFAVPPYAKDAAEVMRAYAGRLERGKEDFDGYAAYAKRHGLMVYANVIWTPSTSLRVCPDPNGPDSPELREWKAYQAKVDVYNDLSSRVGKWWGELDVWIAEQFGKLVAGVEKLKEANSVYKGLVHTNEKVIELAFRYAEARQTRDLNAFRSAVSKLQDQAKVFSRQLRSGNPALRAAAEAADPRGMSKSAGALSDMIERVSKDSKIIPVVGNVIAIVATGAQIENGEAGSSAIASLVGGLGGGAAFSGVAAAAFPPVTAAILVTTVSVAAGWGASSAWEAWVPLDTREAMDAGIKDAWDWAKPSSWSGDTP